LWALATILPFVLLGSWENHNGKVLTDAAMMLNQRAPEQPAPPAQSNP